MVYYGRLYWPDSAQQREGSSRGSVSMRSNGMDFLSHLSYNFSAGAYHKSQYMTS